MKLKIPFKLADEIAAKLLKIFEPACERIEIAGSLRRRKPEVGDLEFVAIPRYISGGQIDLFGNSERVSLLDRRVQKAVSLSLLEVIKNGEKYKQFIHKRPTGELVGIDLFITTVEQWGYIFALRTGSAEFNAKWNTQRNKGGLLPSQFRFEGGWLMCGDEKIPTPDEKEFFALIEIPWIEPSQRSAEALRRSR